MPNYLAEVIFVFVDANGYGENGIKYGVQARPCVADWAIHDPINQSGVVTGTDRSTVVNEDIHDVGNTF